MKITTGSVKNRDREGGKQQRRRSFTKNTNKTQHEKDSQRQCPLSPVMTLYLTAPPRCTSSLCDSSKKAAPFVVSVRSCTCAKTFRLSRKHTLTCRHGAHLEVVGGSGRMGSVFSCGPCRQGDQRLLSLCLLTLNRQ